MFGVLVIHHFIVRQLPDATLEVQGKQPTTVPQLTRAQINFENIVWTVSDWAGIIPAFDVVDARPGHIHIHRNRLTDMVNIWMRQNAPKAWKDCTETWLAYREGAPLNYHPQDHKYVLDAFGDSWTPYYVKAKSTYITKAKNRKDGGLVHFNALSPSAPQETDN